MDGSGRPFSELDLPTLRENPFLREVQAGPTFLPRLDDIWEAYTNAVDIRAIGYAGAAEVRRSILAHGYEIVGEQVYIRTDGGGLRIIDFLISDGPNSFAAIEAKANSATRSATQLMRDGQISMSGGTIVSFAPLFGGLERGDRVRLHTLEVNVTVRRTP